MVRPDPSQQAFEDSGGSANSSNSTTSVDVPVHLLPNTWAGPNRWLINGLLCSSKRRKTSMRQRIGTTWRMPPTVLLRPQQQLMLPPIPREILLPSSRRVGRTREHDTTKSIPTVRFKLKHQKYQAVHQRSISFPSHVNLPSLRWHNRQKDSWEELQLWSHASRTKHYR